jgi:hypothetical protein
MHSPSPLPMQREVFLDARGDGRALRATWHAEPAVVVFSLWRDRTCVGTFRLPVEEVPAMVDLLRACLEDAYDGARDSFLASFGAVDDEVG